jgi:hypothetical protein
MMARYVKLVVMTAALVLAVSSLRAQDGLEGALPRANLASPLNLAAPFDQKLAIADFDNDHKPDGAVLVGSGRLAGQNSFRIELHLSHSNNTDLTFESPESSLAITAWDINKDGAADVVVEQPLTHKRLYVWLGDGHGGFYKGRVEDFPSPDVITGERLESPTPRPDCPAVCLGQQRGTELALLTSQSLLRRAPPANQFKSLPIASKLASPGSSPDASRAPPLFP